MMASDLSHEKKRIRESSEKAAALEEKGERAGSSSPDAKRRKITIEKKKEEWGARKLDVQKDDKQEDKRRKVDMSNMEEDVVKVINDMQEMSKGQKSKYKAKLRKNDPDLYERYNIAYNGRAPETEEKEKNEGKETKEPKPEPASEPKPEPASTKPKINRQTPIPAPSEVKEEKEETVPVSWEDETNESWVQPTNESIAAAASNESWVEVKKDLKDRKKISMSFNSKAEKTFNKPRVSESSSKDEEDKLKDGLTKIQRKNRKKRAKKGAQGGPDVDLNVAYPPGHPQYEAAKAAREAKEAEEKQQRHRQYQASYPQGQRSRSGSRIRKPWELQTIKRDDGSIILQEVKGDLFGCPSSAALVVSVGADFHMSKGIVEVFKRRFGGVGQLTSFGAHAGGLAYLNRGGRFIYYLVTKDKYNKRPTMRTMESSLTEMRDHCEKNGVIQVAMPTIGCGIDKLEWEDVRDLLIRMFRNTKVEITVYKV